ncbi:hypothetical protein HOD29_07075 [archaeon]|jgi:MtN3 and saliva related transmembrane protein|nr:hypothetical protein [archaeon]
MFIEIFHIIVSIFGILMSVGHFPQAYKIYKNKTSKDVSLITYFIFFIGSFIWLIYGFLLQEIPIIISFIIGVVGSFSVLFMAVRYR